MTISAVVLTKNAQDSLSSCLSSLSFCDEVVLVDDVSSDKTVEIAKQFPNISIFSRNLENDFASQRNFGLSKAKGEWVLFIDADEVIDKRLKDDILSAIKSTKYVGFYLKRRDILWGKPLLHGENGHRQILRLGRKDAGVWSGKVHEEWEVKGKTGVLTHYLLHYPHPTVVEFLKEINRYTTLRAEELHKKGVTVGTVDILLYPIGKFIQNYLYRMGFLDGVRGLITATIMSMHSFLVRGKVWELQKKSSS